jgi:ATP-binding cassette, subfamily F, member 3
VLSVSGLSKSHGSRVLFRDVGFRLLPGRRVALVGGNGVGKTTILEIIVGLLDADDGEVARQKDVRIGYLPQELLEAWQGTVLDEVLRGAGDVLALEHELRSLEHRMADTTGDEHDRVLAAYGVAQSRFEQLGGYQVEADARRILGGLGFTTADMDRPLKELSGGWQMRAALARLLLDRPDILVLDEPTNHLDVDSVAWLEQQLVAWPGAILFVSHDRDFIDAVAERVIEVSNLTATEYVGGFAEFVVQREERIRALEAAAANQARKVAHTERFIERFRYKASKARQVQSRIKALEKLDQIEVPSDDQLKLRFGFPPPQRSSRVVIELEGVSVGYGDGPPVLTGVDLVVERGEKIALVGPNGAGKSTLLKLVLGQLEPSAGTARMGANVDIAYFAQHQVDALDLSKTVEQEFRHTVGEQPKNRNIRTILGSFGFGGEAAERIVGDLSGGERTRLALAEAMCNPVNLLVLDEPTNHLDLPSCDVLEDALSVYPGTVLLVSHDRHLIRNVAQRLVEVRDGRVTLHADVEEHVLSPGTAPAPPPAAPAPRSRPSGPSAPAPPSADRRTAKRSDAERRQARSQATRDLRKNVERLEKQVGRAEDAVAALQRRLADPAVYDDADQMRALVAEHDAAKDAAIELMARWEAAMVELDRVEARFR